MAILEGRLLRHAARALAATAVLMAAAASAWCAPQRVVSINLCADQLVVALADAAQVAGVSPFAADPELSVVAAQARALPTLDQRSEAMVALRPDLVLVGPNDRSHIRRALTNLGLTVHEVGVVPDVAAARAQVRELATLLGHPARGEALVAEIDRAQARLKAAAVRPGTALIAERRGYVAGPESLAATLLGEAGLSPPAGAPGGLGGFVSLERLLTLRPDVLVLHDPVTAAEDQGALFLAHPALAALYPPERRVLLPRKYALCGGPALVAALNYLADRLTRRGNARDLTGEPAPVPNRP